MKWSQFNCLIHSKGNCYYLHNTRMLSLIKLDKNSYIRLKEIEKRPNIAKDILNGKDYDYLIKAKVLVKDYEDESYINKLKYIRRKKSFTSSSLGLVICPTLACNFSCPYCYEHNLPNKKMSESVQMQLMEFINRYSDKVNDIKISWHGGEPLLAFDTIQEIYSQIEKRVKLEITGSSMVSNGYLLTKEMCHFFNEKKLEYLQITIDGKGSTHNKTRKLKNGESSYEKILSNIDMATVLMPNCRIGIRTNIGRTNKDEYIELYRELSQRWKNKNCQIYHSFVDSDLNSEKNYIDNLALTTNEKNDFLINLCKSGILDKECLKSHLDCSFNTCSNNNSFVIDPEGFLYKCWADVGKRKRSIGNLTEGITNYDIVSQYIIGSDKFSDQKCIKCHYLPVCNGGCNLYRVNFMEEGIPYDVCTINDEGLAKYINIYSQE